MNGSLHYALLALVFLLVSGLVALVGALGSRRLGGRSRALSERLRRIASQREGERQDSLLKAEAQAAGVGAWLARRLPGVQALDALVLRSGSRQSRAEVLLICAGVAALAFLLLVVLARVPMGLAAVLALALAGLPLLRLVHLERKRRLRFEEQLPEGLDLMTRALRAGYGLSMALGMVGDEMQDPLACEFKRCFDQLNVGMNFGEAMGDMTTRVRSNDLNFLVIALTIQRKTGGNLTELLTSLAKTMRERVKLKGKVRVLSSEGRLSGILIGALPFVLGCILTIINPTYMATLWTTEAGRMVVLVGLIMLALGGLWMWKIVQIKV